MAQAKYPRIGHARPDLAQAGLDPLWSFGKISSKHSKRGKVRGPGKRPKFKERLREDGLLEQLLEHGPTRGGHGGLAQGRGQAFAEHVAQACQGEADEGQDE